MAGKQFACVLWKWTVPCACWTGVLSAKWCSNLQCKQGFTGCMATSWLTLNLMVRLTCG